MLLQAQCPITERLCVALMMHGRNSGKKMKAMRIIRSTLDIIHVLTDQNPIQIVEGMPRHEVQLPICKACSRAMLWATS